MLGQVELSKIPVGKNFKVWNKNFTVLKQEKDRTLVLAAKIVKTMPFREKDKIYKVAPNDFRDSSIKKYLNGEYIRDLVAAGLISTMIFLRC